MQINLQIFLQPGFHVFLNNIQISTSFIYLCIHLRYRLKWLFKIQVVVVVVVVVMRNVRTGQYNI
jgi:hypothetical protein